MKSTATQLEEARQVLKGLQEDLPRYHGYLTEAQQAEVELQKAFRAGSGSFSNLTEAKTATMTARELLEQHQADMASAQAEVSRLEAEINKAKNEREWAAIQQERQAIESEWNARLTELTRSYLQGLKSLEPLLERRQKYFQRMQLAARAVGIVRPEEQNRHLFDLDVSALQDLKEFQPSPYSGSYSFTVGQRLFRVTVGRG